MISSHYTGNSRSLLREFGLEHFQVTLWLTDEALVWDGVGKNRAAVAQYTARSSYPSLLALPEHPSWVWSYRTRTRRVAPTTGVLPGHRVLGYKTLEASNVH